jgi:hypothetical protein
MWSIQETAADGDASATYPQLRRNKGLSWGQAPGSLGLANQLYGPQNQLETPLAIERQSLLAHHHERECCGGGSQSTPIFTSGKRSQSCGVGIGFVGFHGGPTYASGCSLTAAGRFKSETGLPNLRWECDYPDTRLQASGEFGRALASALAVSGISPCPDGPSIVPGTRKIDRSKRLLF